MRGEIGGVGGSGGKSAVVSFRTCVRGGNFLRSGCVGMKVKGFPSIAPSALGGGVDSTNESVPTP